MRCPSIVLSLLLITFAPVAHADGSACGKAQPNEPEAKPGFVTHRCPHIGSSVLQRDAVLDGILPDAVDEADARAQAMTAITAYCNGAKVEDPYIRLRPVERDGRTQWRYVALVTCTPR